MKRTLLTFTAITSLLLPLAAPIVAVAQDGGRQRESAVQRRVEAAQRHLDRDTQTQRAPEARQEQRQERSEPRQRPQQNRPDASPQRRGDNGGPQVDRSSRDQPRRDYRQDRRNESPVQRRVEEAQRQLDRANGVRPDQSRDRDDRYRDRRDDNRDNRRWDTRRDRPSAEYRRDNYRDFQRRWDSQQWRRDFNRDRRSDWWRNDSRFRSWSGIRMGFYFAPGYGYYNVPRSYWNQHWQVGQYLPEVFWRYQVNDYRTYGLGYPPEGTRWVYVDNSIYLIDDYDGYIVEVIRDAWRW